MLAQSTTVTEMVILLLVYMYHTFCHTESSTNNIQVHVHIHVLSPAQSGSQTAEHFIMSLTNKPEQRLSKAKQADLAKMFTTYFKFAVIRNPTERLFSAFMHLVSPPLSFDFSHGVEMIKHQVARKIRPSEYKQWLANNGTPSMNVSFEEFITWFVQADKPELDSHLQPFLAIAQPCTVQYNYYVRFKNYSNELVELLKLLGKRPGTKKIYNIPTNVGNSRVHLHDYFGKLNRTLKTRLYHTIHEDLAFYYTLEPEDEHFNMKLLEQY